MKAGLGGDPGTETSGRPGRVAWVARAASHWPVAGKIGWPGLRQRRKAVRKRARGGERGERAAGEAGPPGVDLPIRAPPSLPAGGSSVSRIVWSLSFIVLPAPEGWICSERSTVPPLARLHLLARLLRFALVCPARRCPCRILCATSLLVVCWTLTSTLAGCAFVLRSRARTLSLRLDRLIGGCLTLVHFRSDSLCATLSPSSSSRSSRAPHSPRRIMVARVTCARSVHGTFSSWSEGWLGSLPVLESTGASVAQSRRARRPSRQRRLTAPS